jgi:hypothetical protein
MATNSSNKSIVYPSGTTANRPSSVNNGYIYFNTTIGALQIYQNGSWYVLTNINAPGVPTSVVATDQGSGRAYNNGKASVAFNPATETFGFPATYTITPTPTTSPATFTGTSSPIIVTGLASSTQYTYTATATNNTGTSSASSASSGVTATTVPQAPTIGAVTGGAASASVAFTAGATGGASATYTVTSDPGNITATGSSSPITVTGLTDGTAYTFTVTATNSNGTSAASSASSSVTPQSWAPEGAYDALATVTLSQSTSTITFAGIPSEYKHLQLRCIAKTDRTETDDVMYIQFNSDTGSNYSWHSLRGNGTLTASGAGTSKTYIEINYGATGDSGASNIFANSVTDILDYTDTNKYTTTRTMNGMDLNGSGWVYLHSGNWRSTSAITSITLDQRYGSNFKQYSQFALYGVK